MKHLAIPVAISLICCMSTARAVENTLKVSKFALTAKSDLGEVTFTYHITPDNKSADVAVQAYARRDDVKTKVQWDPIVPGENSTPPIISLFKGIDNTGTFKVGLKKGVYGACRVMLFNSPDGKSIDFGHVIYDSNADKNVKDLKLSLTVLTSDKRVLQPHLVLPKTADVVDNKDGTVKVNISAELRIPRNYKTQDEGLFLMAKGEVGFSQVWAALKDGSSGGNALDDYRKIPVKFSIGNVKPGLWNIQFGVFKPTFGDPLEWLWPGLDVEVGGEKWITKAPDNKVPPRLRVRNNHFENVNGAAYDFYADNPAGKKAVTFVRGGNYGNAICWTIRPELDTPGYFEVLKEAGVKYLRMNVSPDRYYDESLYRHVVDQVIQNMWSSGVYPILCPQDLPQADTIEKRIEKGLEVVKAMAQRYKGKSIWLEVCNEPHEFTKWADWKPVAVKYAKAIREIDADAFVIVPFEGYSKDSTDAAKDPIKDVHVDLYDAHAYVEPEDVAKLYGPAIKARLPVLIGEYGSTDAGYLSKMDLALQKLPGILAAGPWAFTIKGQDMLPLVEDGSTATLKFTAAGKAIADDYAAWDAGKRKVE